MRLCLLSRHHECTDDRQVRDGQRRAFRSVVGGAPAAVQEGGLRARDGERDGPRPLGRVDPHDLVGQPHVGVDRARHALELVEPGEGSAVEGGEQAAGGAPVDRGVDGVERERPHQFLAAVAADGLLPDGDATDEQGLVEALHRYLAQSPALLFNVSLVDAVGERRMQNQPGTGDEYPNWRVPLADSAGNPVLIEQLPDNARANSLVRAVNEALGNRSRLRPVGEPEQPQHTDRTAP